MQVRAEGEEQEGVAVGDWARGSLWLRGGGQRCRSLWAAEPKPPEARRSLGAGGCPWRARGRFSGPQGPGSVLPGVGTLAGSDGSGQREMDMPIPSQRRQLRDSQSVS